MRKLSLQQFAVSLDGYILELVYQRSGHGDHRL